MTTGRLEQRAGRGVTALAVVAAMLCSFGPGAGAHAQEPIPQDAFSVMRFSPAPGPRNYFMVEGASTPGHLQGSVGLVLDYAHQPFVLWNTTCRADGTDCEVDDTRAELVQYTAAGHITGSFQLFDRLQIGAVLPLVLTSGQEFAYSTRDRGEVTLPGGDAFVLADPRLNVKGRIFTDASSGFSLGASAFVTFPTGHAIAEQRYVGDVVPSFGGHVIAEIVNSGFRGAVNVGGTWREDAQFLSTQVGPQLTYAVALGYDITPLVGVFGEMTGASTFTQQVDEHWLEWRLGGRLRVEDFQIDLAGGSGVISGVGTPLFRIIGGFAWAPVHADTDADGVEDSQDSCPSESEDLDGFEDDDGCPESDNDGDGFADADDPCPDEAEDMDGFEDEDGCPDTDNDGDEIPDGYDSCPNDPEDMDDDRDEDGCPDNDTDRDGIEDAADQCPEEAEDFDGFGDEDGCPEEDFDGDGLADIEDQCPDQAEDTDGFEDEDGCPEQGGEPLPEEPAAAEAEAGDQEAGDQ